MPVLKGTATGSILRESYDIPSTIKSYSMVNKTGGTVNYNIWVVVAGVLTAIRYGSLGAFASYSEGEANIKMLQGYEILITTSGEIDYFFSIE